VNNGVTWTVAASNPQTIPTGTYPVGRIQVRLVEIDGLSGNTLKTNRIMRLKDIRTMIDMSSPSATGFDDGNSIVEATNNVYQRLQNHKINFANPHLVDFATFGVTATTGGLNDLLNNTHVQNRNQILDEGNANEVTASEIRSHIDDKSIHGFLDDNGTGAYNLYSASNLRSKLADYDIVDFTTKGVTGEVISVTGTPSDAVVSQIVYTDLPISSLQRVPSDLSKLKITTSVSHGWVTLGTVSLSAAPSGSGVVDGDYTIFNASYNEFEISVSGGSGIWYGGIASSDDHDLDIGEINIGFGVSDDLSSTDIKVYNSGKDGLPARAMIRSF